MKEKQGEIIGVYGLNDGRKTWPKKTLTFEGNSEIGSKLKNTLHK